MAEKLNPDGLLALADQLLGMVEEKASAETALMDDLVSRIFRISSACQEDHVELLTWTEDLQRQVSEVEDELQNARLRNQAGEPEEVLRRNCDAFLQQEKTLKEKERVLREKLEALSVQRESLQLTKESLRKLHTDMQRNQMVLALCASTFHIIPSDEGSNRVAGNLVDSKGHVVDTFGFDIENMNAVDVSDKLWNLCIAK